MRTKNLLATIRTRLSLLPLEDSDRAYSELIGLSLANSFIKLNGEIVVSFENAPSARRLIRILDLLRIPHNLSSYVSDRFGGSTGHKYEIVFVEPNIYRILIDHEYLDNIELLPQYYLRGLFLARGNLYISTHGGYRLTFASRYEFALSYAADLLSEMRISFAMQKRTSKDIWFLHIMKFDEIIDILKWFGLKREIKLLETIYATRARKKQAVRLTNIEVANLKRVSKASTRQIKKLTILNEKDVPPKLLPLWKLRISPDGKLLSYRELAERLGWTKAKVSRGLKKLERLSDEKKRKDI